MAPSIKPMTTKEFSDATGISIATISKLIRAGKLKAKKKGKAWIIPPNQLESSTIRETQELSQAAKARKSSGAPTAIRAAKASEPEIPEPEPLQPPATSMALASTMAPEEQAPPKAPEPTTPEKSYSIPEFAAMTYLTEKGVSEWLSIGRLQGCKSENGEWRVLESNLRVPDILRLVRK
jgi:hypothetical protein